MEEKIIKWMQIVFIGAGCICVIALMFMFVGVMFKQYSMLGWDFLAFIGAIIGGGLTLAGVQMTLANQRRTEFLKEYPEKRKLADDLLNYLIDELYGIELAAELIREGSNGTTLRACFRRLEAQTDEKRIVAAKINEDVYTHVNDFFQRVNLLKEFVKGSEYAEASPNERADLIHNYIKDSLSEKTNAIGESIANLIRQYRKYKSK